MKSQHASISAVLLALGLWTIPQLSLAADAHARHAPQANAPRAEQTAATDRKAPPRQVVLVDINSASKEELKKLPHIGDAEAARIIAGRPYLSKAHLQTHKVVSPEVYQDLRELVVARQKDARFGKAGK